MQPGDFLYTLPGTPNDPSATRTSVTTLRTSARALGIRIGIDTALAAALEQAPVPPVFGHEPAAPDGPALTTVVPARPAPATAPRPHPIR
jgi:hypothetical protein